MTENLESKAGYERIGSWNVSEEIPGTVRASLRASFDSIQNEHYSANNQHGTLFSGNEEKPGESHGSQSYFTLARLTGGSSGVNAPFIPPNPHTELDSYFKGGPVDTYENDLSAIEKKKKDISEEIRDATEKGFFDRFRGHLRSEEKKANEYPIIRTEVVALKPLSANIHEMPAGSEERSEVIDAWKEDPNAHYSVKLVFDYKTRDSRIESANVGE